MTRKEQWMNVLDERFADFEKEDAEGSRNVINPSPYTKLEYLSEDVFNYTTYESGMSQLFAYHTLRVIKAILDRTTYEFIEEDGDRVTYLTVVNWPFLAGKLEWGGSIRGAWFDTRAAFEVCGGEILIGTGEINEFMQTLLEWAGQQTLIARPLELNG